MSAIQNHHVYVGSEVGLLKGVDIENEAFNNLNSVENLKKDNGITAMCWGDASQKKVCIGLKNQIVKVFDSELKSFTLSRHFPTGEGSIKGLYYSDGNVVTAAESGIVKLWKENGEQKVEINTGGDLCKMIPNPFTDSKSIQVATGGNENDLKIWDLGASHSPLFRAKNVKHDSLELRVPVWIEDIKFKSECSIVTCTRHHQIRLYDTRDKRRPVIDMEFERYPLMSLSLAHNDNQVVVGSSRGRMALIDLRKKLLVHVFKGFAGSICCVQCHPTLPMVASCSLDRCLRIHDLNTHKLLKKVYLKTRLNCLLFKTALENPIQDTTIPKTKPSKNLVEKVDEEEEKLWNSMSVVKDGQKRKKTLSNNDIILFKKKKNRRY